MQIIITDQRKASGSFSNSNCAVAGHALCRRAPRKSSKSRNGDSAVAKVIAVFGGGDIEQLDGFEGQRLIHLTSDMPGLDQFYALFTADEWRAFIAGVKLGEFDLDDEGLLPVLAAAQGGEKS